VAKPVPVPDDFDEESNLGESPPDTGRPLMLDIDNEEREGRADISINDNIGVLCIIQQITNEPIIISIVIITIVHHHHHLYCHYQLLLSSLLSSSSLLFSFSSDHPYSNAQRYSHHH